VECCLFALKDIQTNGLWEIFPKDNYLGGLRKGSELCTESLFFAHPQIRKAQKYYPQSGIFSTSFHGVFLEILQH
jgi:hypothetical protein